MLDIHCFYLVVKALFQEREVGEVQLCENSELCCNYFNVFCRSIGGPVPNTVNDGFVDKLDGVRIVPLYGSYNVLLSSEFVVYY